MTYFSTISMIFSKYIYAHGVIIYLSSINFPGCCTKKMPDDTIKKEINILYAAKYN